MNQQLAFDESGDSPGVQDVRGLSRWNDSDTAKSAAQQITRSCEDAIRRLFALPRQLTDDELCDLLPEWEHKPTVKSARSRLSNAGFLVDSGARRLSARGHSMTVWVRA